MKFRKTNYMSADDHKLVSLAVAEAENTTDGEIVTIVADISDKYKETAYVWASLSALAVLAAFAVCPEFYTALINRFTGEWNPEFTIGQYVAIAGSFALLKWLAIWFIFHWQPLRLLLTLSFVKKTAVRQRSIDLFRVGIESRTAGRTGILIYLSMKEHRAEIVADEAIASKVNAAIWGDAMLALVENTRAGNPGTGMAEAVAQVGAVLSEHFPKSDGNPNELPDRLIEL